MKEGINLNNFPWTEKTISDLNEKIFFKAVMRFNQPKIGVSVPLLLNYKARVIADTEKVKLFEIIFFRDGHLNGKKFDENFLTKAKSVVNMAL